MSSRRCLVLQIVVVSTQLLLLVHQAMKREPPAHATRALSAAEAAHATTPSRPPPPPPLPPPLSHSTSPLPHSTSAQPSEAKPGPAGHAAPAAVAHAQVATDGGKPGGPAAPLIVFPAGIEGSGHDAIGALLLRLPQVWPMALTEEQSFMGLWWGDDPAAVMPSAQEVLADWVGQARLAGKRLAAFGARSCLVEPPHTDCSWVAGAQLQRRPGARAALPAGWELRTSGEPFSFPFANTAEPGKQKVHYPTLHQLPAMAAALAPPAPVGLLVLWRAPLECLVRRAAAQPARFWRVAELDARLRLLALGTVRAGHELHRQLLALPRAHAARARVLRMDELLAPAAATAATAAAAGALAAALGLAAADVGAALREAVALEQAAAAEAAATVGEGRRARLRAALDAAAREAPPGEAAWLTALPAALSKLQPAAGGPGGGGASSASVLQWAAPGGAAALAPPPPPPPPPPLPLAALRGVTLTHVINPFRAPSAEHRRAQNLTLASIEAARREAARHGVCVQLVAAVYAEDRGVSREAGGGAAGGAAGAAGGAAGAAGGAAGAAGAAGGEPCALAPAVEVEIRGSLSEGLPGVAHRATLPLLPAILRAGHARGTGRHLVYSNIDIALQRDAYVQLATLLARQPDTPISAIREEFENAGDGFQLADAYAQRGKGLPHPGHDLWAFPRAWVPALSLRDVALGVSLVATALNQALLARAGCRLTLLSRHLSFHVIEGESVVKHKWLQRARHDALFRETYAAWNCAQTLAGLADAVAASPAARDCWYTQQVTRSINAYKCASYVPQLPPAPRAAWTAAAAALAPMFPRFAAAGGDAQAQRGGGANGGGANGGGKAKGGGASGGRSK